MERMTLARKNEILRGKAVLKVVNHDVLGTELLQVAGSKYMVNVEFEGEIYPVRVDFVVPKIDKDDECQFAEDFAEAYREDQEKKLQLKEEKEKAKAKKIERDKKLREEKRAREEEEEDDEEEDDEEEDDEEE